MRYTQYINRRRGRSGHLWQDRFYSSGLDDEYFWMAMVYVERNPVRAKLVRRAWRYPWSSAAAHCGQGGTTDLLDLDAWREMLGRVNWQNCLIRPEDEQKLERLRGWTNRGCPLGSDSFISKLERKFRRRLRPLPVGRPRKKK
jgi:putative transposase